MHKTWIYTHAQIRSQTFVNLKFATLIPWWIIMITLQKKKKKKRGRFGLTNLLALVLWCGCNEDLFLNLKRRWRARAFFSPGPGPRSGLSSAPALLACRCRDNVFLQRPSPALWVANWWTWSWCAAASFFHWDRMDPRKTCRELKFKRPTFQGFEHFLFSFFLFFLLAEEICESDVWPKCCLFLYNRCKRVSSVSVNPD